MKKLLLLLTLCGVMVACADDKKGKDDASKNEVTKNEVTKDDASKNGVAKNDVDKNDVDKNSIIKYDVYATLNQMVDALYDETPDNFIKAFKAMDAKYNSASEADQKMIDEATDQWRKENPEKADMVFRACDELRKQGLL